jgi:hypothetical protein
MKEREIRLRVRLYSAVLTLIVVGGFFLTYIFAQESSVNNPIASSEELMNNNVTNVNYPLPYSQKDNRTALNQQDDIVPDYPAQHEVYSNKGIKLYIYTYPNPVKDYLILQIFNQELVPLYYQLYDGKGVALGGRRIISDETNIEMDGLNPGMYILKVREDNTDLETFKVMKSK